MQLLQQIFTFVINEIFDCACLNISIWRCNILGFSFLLAVILLSSYEIKFYRIIIKDRQYLKLKIGNQCDHKSEYSLVAFHIELIIEIISNKAHEFFFILTK